VQIVDIPITQLREAPWNPNQMDDAGFARLRRSIQRFGLVGALVVRPLDDRLFETIGGAQRLSVLKELGFETAPCVVVEADDVSARLLSQALNRIQGQDDLGLKAELLREVLRDIPETDVLSLLPESASSLQALSILGQQDLASYLQDWQHSQSARLKHLTFQSTPAQLEVIEEALARVLPQVRADQFGNPNPRGNALFLLCKQHLELIGRES